MLFLGHLGIGSRLARLFSRDLPLPWIFLGTILPDLIDKSLYYGFRHVWPWMSCTRIIGHTGVLLLTLTLGSVLAGSRKGLAVALGVLTHLVLDVAGDGFELFDASASARAILFPLMGPFTVEHKASLLVHASDKLQSHYVLYAEAIGAALLLAQWLSARRESRRPARS
jgi:hypothetical protein